MTENKALTAVGEPEPRSSRLAARPECTDPLLGKLSKLQELFLYSISLFCPNNFKCAIRG